MHSAFSSNTSATLSGAKRGIHAALQAIFYERHFDQSVVSLRVQKGDSATRGPCSATTWGCAFHAATREYLGQGEESSCLTRDGRVTDRKP